VILEGLVIEKSAVAFHGSGIDMRPGTRQSNGEVRVVNVTVFVSLDPEEIGSKGNRLPLLIIRIDRAARPDNRCLVPRQHELVAPLLRSVFPSVSRWVVLDELSFAANDV
jgi:hypothetical protein